MVTAHATPLEQLDLTGQGPAQLLALLVALVLCTLIGFERELRHKSAGLRTHTLVGVGAALFVVVSKFGFHDVITTDDVSLDPSRIAGQIVSGVGFIGAGLIFVRQDIVRGLTTAATIWLSAAVGTAAGAGLWLAAAAVTAGHFLVALGYPPVLRWLTRSRPTTASFLISYEGAREILRGVLTVATEQGFTVQRVRTVRRQTTEPGTPVIDLALRVHGKGDVNDLAVALSETEGVLSVQQGEPEDTEE
ncbi:putative Mg2+ transporter-C (MgtC) family protein [Lipingzhangella halophila]|uniref:Putative Mg2+ transporter-C (MgtC) family protein n=1 Tax=Lipingzhangella halophila TaxID=1783352 RepID=A0A7W7RG89_9ACTN|nr:MgtC/SapB family protein [Lipingzhangella halophila]MBB4931434.1 putative Mg2+ transporter-C (MgtC) family protein [Lipingzhangella halophila]